MFIAHKNDIPINGYKPIEQHSKKTVVVNNGDFKLTSNVCPHQLSLISIQSGTGNRVCPYHNWTFDLNGNPLTSGRTGHYCKNSVPLNTQPLHMFNSMLFNMPITCKELEWLDLSSMELVEQRVDKVKAPSRSIMDVFLDVDHIQTVHRGVYDNIGLPNITEVDWHYYSWGSLQLVPGSQGVGAAWLAIYPGTMIEWQPGALFVTVTDDNQFETNVHVFKYKDKFSTLEEWTINQDIWETSWQQDKAQAEILTAPTDHNLEPSKQHFRLHCNK